MALDPHGLHRPDGAPLRTYEEALAERLARARGWSRHGAHFVLRDGFGLVCNSDAPSWAELCRIFSIGE